MTLSFTYAKPIVETLGRRLRPNGSRVDEVLDQLETAVSYGLSGDFASARWHARAALRAALR